MGEEWRTLTYADLRPGDVIRMDEDGPEETVRSCGGPFWPRHLASVTRTEWSVYRRPRQDPVLVRHPRPQGDES